MEIDFVGFFVYGQQFIDWLWVVGQCGDCFVIFGYVIQVFKVIVFGGLQEFVLFEEVQVIVQWYLGV